jgi:hypothetical protein
VTALKSYVLSNDCRSREKRRISDMVLETRVLALTRENTLLKSELFAIKDKFGLPHNQQFVEKETTSLISLGENRGRRDKLLKTLIGAGKSKRSLCPGPTERLKHALIIRSLDSDSNGLHNQLANSSMLASGNQIATSHFLGQVLCDKGSSLHSSPQSSPPSSDRMSPHSSGRSAFSGHTNPASMLASELSGQHFSSNPLLTFGSSHHSMSTLAFGSLSDASATRNFACDASSFDKVNELRSLIGFGAFGASSAFSNGFAPLDGLAFGAKYESNGANRYLSESSKRRNSNASESSESPLMVDVDSNESMSIGSERDCKRSEHGFKSSGGTRCASGSDNDDENDLNSGNGSRPVSKATGSLADELHDDAKALACRLQQNGKMVALESGGNSLPFKLRHKARNSPSDNTSESGSDCSPSPDLLATES